MERKPAMKLHMARAKAMSLLGESFPCTPNWALGIGKTQEPKRNHPQGVVEPSFSMDEDCFTDDGAKGEEKHAHGALKKTEKNDEPPQDLRGRARPRARGVG